MAEKLYGLFRDGKRLQPNTAFPKKVAVRHWQDNLIYDGCELKPIKADKPTPTPRDEILCDSCERHQHQCAKGDCACGCRIIKG